MVNRLSGPEKAVRIIIALVVPALAIFFLVKYRHFYHDDEMISLRYARNLIKGNGLVWNPGERIEGYTNFLHLVFSVGFIRMFGDYLLAPRIVNFLFFALMLLTGYFIVRHRNITSRDRSLSVQVFFLVIATFPGLYIWSYGALEVVMYASLLFMAVSFTLLSASTLRNGIFLGILFACTSMTRPEGNFIFFITLGYLFLLALKDKNWAKFAGALVTYGLLYGIYFALRYHYYGQLLPNTFYAKTSFSARKFYGGALYVSRFLLAILFSFASLLFLLCVNRSLFRWNRGQAKPADGRGRSIAAIGQGRSAAADGKIGYILFVLACYTVYITSFGGDHMLGMRFCIPLLPLIALLLIFLLDRTDLKAAGMIVRAGLLINAIYVCVLPINSFRMTTQTDPAAAVGFYVGSYIKENMPEDYLVATNSAGAIPFFAENNRFVDMLGLCDSTIARRKIDKETAKRFSWPGHEKGDGKYVLSRRPDIIILGPAQGNDASEPTLLSDVEIVADPFFRSAYERKTVEIDTKTTGHWPSHVQFKNAKIGDKLLFTYYQLKK